MHHNAPLLYIKFQNFIGGDTPEPPLPVWTQQKVALIALGTARVNEKSWLRACISSQYLLAVPADGHAGVLGLLALHALVLKLYRCHLHHKDGLRP
mgnify:CR=1 FL=1